VHEFESFVYLDVPKTGSTFIKGLLRKQCIGPQIAGRAHSGISNGYDYSKLCFISVRDPLDQYLSLYSFGCESKGGLYGRMRAMGAENLYDGSWSGFLNWLRFVLKPGNAACVDPDYAECGNGRICKLVGYQSFRVLCLTIPDAYAVLRKCRDREAVKQVYRSRKAHQFAIRFETFQQDLVELLKTSLRPYLKDLDKAIKHASRDAANTSKRVLKGEGEHALPNGLRRKLKEREWLLCEEFGYGLEMPDKDSNHCLDEEPAREKAHGQGNHMLAK
jgi:hypothetical protein